MPSVQAITSHKPVTGLVNRRAKHARKPTQSAKLKNLALTMPKFREMVNGQKLESLQPRVRREISSGYNYNSYGCHWSDDGRGYWNSGCSSECEDCRGTF